jgi:SAM-dependent methyltransferase
MAVLDVCCGMGASAIPAAERVGPTGNVIAVDLAEKLLSKGSQRATAQGLTNIEFLRADLESLPFPDRTFDAVLCVFGILSRTCKERSGSCGVLCARMGCSRSPFGVAACSNQPTAHSGKQSAARIRNSIGRSNHGARSLSPIRSGAPTRVRCV